MSSQNDYTVPVWVSIGPYREGNFPDNVVPAAGQILGIDVSPDYDGAGHPAMYLAMAGGGVWRSSDFLSATPTWTPLTDHLPGIPDARRVDLNDVITLSVDPQHPQTIYARAGGSPPALLKSTDGGNNWVFVGEGQFDGASAIWRVLVDPQGTLYAAFNEGGFWQSIDGGANWINVAKGTLDGVTFHDAVYFIDQNGQLTIYVGVVGGGNRSGLWSFTDGQWRQMPITLLNLRGETFSPDMIQRIRMSADPIAGVCASFSQASTLMEAGYVFTQQSAGTVPLHRLFNPTSGAHFYTISDTERDNAIARDGYRSEGEACYVFAQQSAGTVPLHRLFNPTSGDHFYTLSDGERDSAIARHGYQSEGEACYVFAQQSAGTVLFYRVFNPTIHKRFYTASDAEYHKAKDRDGYQDEGVDLLNVFRLIQGTWEPQWFSIDNWFDTQAGQVQGVCIAPDGRLYAGGVGLAQSAGGGSFVDIRTDSHGNRIHVDEHVIFAYQSQIYVGTDGGLTRFTPQPGQPGVVTWESLNTPSLTNFLSTGASAHPTDPGIFLVGNQDNGIARRASNGQWSYSGFSNEREKLRFDPDPANQGRFAFSYDPNNGFYMSQDGGVSFPQTGFGPPGVPAPNLPPPFGFHPHNSARIMIGWTTVYETPDRGITWNQKLTLPEPQTPSALTYAGDHSAYIGTQNGQLYETHNDGQNWPVVDFDFAPSIVSLCTDSANPDAIYVATPNRVLRRLHPQAAWEDLSGNLALAIGVMALLADRPGTDPFLFVGTGAGVFFAPLLNGANTVWRRFGTGLPDAGQFNNTVTDLEITASRRFLLAATWGRGAWGTTILPDTMWHTIRHSDGSWQPVFDDVERQVLPPGIFDAVSCAGINGELHVCGITEGGGMWHTIRHTDGSWQPFFGDVKSQTSDPGPFSAVGCAGVNGELHLCGVTTNGGMSHTIRHADGSWQPFFGDVKRQTSDPGLFRAVGCAGINGELHICGVTEDGRMWHTIRHADGSWQSFFGDVKRQTSDPGPFSAVSCAGVNGELQVCGVITLNGGMWHTIRHTDGSWQPFFGDVKSQSGNPGPFSAVGCAGVNGELQVCGVIVTNGGLWHTIRHADGSWQPFFGDVKSQSGDPGRLIRAGCAGIGGELHISAITLA